MRDNTSSGGAVRAALAALIALMVCLAGPARAQEFVLDVSIEPNAKAVTFQVPSTGETIPLTLVKKGSGTLTSVTITATAFLADGGGRIAPSLAANNQTGPRITLPISADSVPAFSLVVPALDGPGPYTGSLIIGDANGASTRQVIAIAAGAPPRPASLQVSPESTTHAHPFIIWNPFRRSQSDAPQTLEPKLGPTFEIHVADGAGRWALDNVTTGPVAVTKAPDGLNASQNIAFYDSRGERVTLPRTVPASGETLTMQLRNLVAGEYVASIPFRAANGSIESRRFAFAVNVRHAARWAILCVSIALLLSFAGSKLIEIRNERQRLTTRIEELSPRWLRDEEETFAIVWISSIVTQAAGLSRTWLLPSLETVHGRLDKAQALLQLIDRLRRARADIHLAAPSPLVRHRALKIAEQIGDEIDPDLDQQGLTDVANKITVLGGWTQAGEVEKLYATALARSVSQLLLEVDVRAIPQTGQTAVQELIDILKSAAPTDFIGLNTREQAYAKLLILWKRRKAPEFAALLDAAKGPVEDVFATADGAAWSRLEQASGRHITHSQLPRIDAHDPVLFTFSSGEKELDDTYLLRHELRYEWTFEAIGKKQQPLMLRPKTDVPRVSQYAPFAGTFKPSLKISFGSKSLLVPGKELAVSRSRRFAAVNGFSAGEIIQFTLALFAAIITGLQTFYYKAGGFGSLPDYLALFAWGATIDQLKNFLQKLPSAAQSIQGAAAAASGGAGTAGGSGSGGSSTTTTTVQAPAAQQQQQAASGQSGGAQQTNTPQQQNPAAPSQKPAENKPANAPAPQIPEPERRTSLDLSGD